tara:strand:- start:3877 stop:4098 length:222 start_codon:yes stop_codon:yes gene_type:complete
LDNLQGPKVLGEVLFQAVVFHVPINSPKPQDLREEVVLLDRQDLDRQAQHGDSHLKGVDLQEFNVLEAVDLNP